MTIQEKLQRVVEDLAKLHRVTEDYKKNRLEEYGRHFIRGKRNFIDFSDEVRVNSAWLKVSGKWKLDKIEEITQLREAVNILNEDVTLLRDARDLDSDTKATCDSVLQQLGEISKLLGPEVKSPSSNL